VVAVVKSVRARARERERERGGGEGGREMRAREKYETKRRTRVNAHRPGYRFLILRAISPVITRAN